jgi:hypothetical protein
MTSILKADNIQDADGNNIINESGNTITIGASGDTTNIIGTLNKDGVAVENTPAFSASRGSDQTGLSTDTFTKIQFNDEEFDTNSMYDNSTNYRFTPTIAGKYLCYYNVLISYDGGGAVEDIRAAFYKNGSVSTHISASQFKDYSSEALSLVLSFSQTSLITFNGSSDYLEVFARNDASGGGVIKSKSNFGAYRIIGA